MKITTVLLGLLMLTAPLDGIAGCSDDMDCKGDRVCVENTCQSPDSDVSEPRVSSDSRTALYVATAAARRRGTVAVVGAGVTMAAGIGTIAAYDSFGASMTLGSVATLTGGVTAPIGGSGGSLARQAADRAGIPRPNNALSTLAWIGYGLSMADALTLVGLGAVGAEPHPALIGSTMTLFSVSALCLGLDARNVANAVEARADHAFSDASPRAPQLRSIRPTFAANVDGGWVGLAGDF